MEGVIFTIKHVKLLKIFGLFPKKVWNKSRVNLLIISDLRFFKRKKVWNKLPTI